MEKLVQFHNLRYNLAISAPQIRIQKLVLCFVLLGLAIILRIPSLEQPINRDISTYATIGAEMQQGLLPYRDIFDHKQPLVYVVFWLINLVAPRSNSAIQITTALISGIACILIFYFLSNRIGIIRAFIASILFTVLAASEIFEGIDLNTEHLLVPIACAAIFFPVYYSEKSSSNWIPVISGVMGALAILTKVVAVFSLPAAMIFLVVSRKRLYSTFIFYSLGIALPILILILIYFFQGALGDLFYANIVHNQLYIGQSTHGLLDFLKNLIKFMVLPSFLNTLVILSLLSAFVKLETKQGKDLITWTILIWFLGAVIGAELSGRDFRHYYIPILAPAIALIALSIEVKGQKVWTFTPLILLAFISFPLLSDEIRNFQINPNNIAIKMFGEQAKSWIVQEDVGKWLLEHANKNDYLFVTGSEPGYYWSSGLKPATRFIYDYPLNVDNSLRTELESDLQNHFPKWVIVPGDSIPPIVFSVIKQDLLKEDVVFGSVHIYSSSK